MSIFLTHYLGLALGSKSDGAVGRAVAKRKKAAERRKAARRRLITKRPIRQR